ncbi:hypothetical protein Ciccas_002177 [Cichlidogyrus casuarinus]|uniref:Uncharacterized protein n=1 Tax=Cichlidogyrus casuarinus TaxID=1844966 RepID=A0ABD2QHZ5_9PLAT
MYAPAEKYDNRDDEGATLLSYKVALVFIAIALVCDIISFVSGFWIVAIDGDNLGFVRLGLWEACFNNFIFPDDYVSKAYRGCWYIYYPEFQYISYWLNPPWFYLVQILSIIALIGNLSSFLVYAMKGVRGVRSSDQLTNRLVIGCQLMASVCFVVIVILVGVFSKDREWMPRPDHNRVSWSFGLAVFAGFFSIMSVASLVTNYVAWQSRYLYAKFENQVVKETGGKGGSVFAYTEPIHGSAKTESHLPSLFKSNLHSYGVPSHISGGYAAGSTSVLETQGKPFATSAANVSSKLREALEAQKAAKEGVASGSAIGQGSHSSIPLNSPPSHYGAPSQTNITMGTTV